MNIRSSISQAIIDGLALDFANVAQRKINACPREDPYVLNILLPITRCEESVKQVARRLPGATYERAYILHQRI